MGYILMELQSGIGEGGFWSEGIRGGGRERRGGERYFAFGEGFEAGFVGAVGTGVEREVGLRLGGFLGDGFKHRK